MAERDVDTGSLVPGGGHDAIVDAYFGAVNEDRTADVAALFAPDAVVHAPMYDPVHGRAAIEQYYVRLLRTFPEHEDRPWRHTYHDDRAIIEVRFDARLRSGGSITLEALDVFEFDVDGCIAKLTTWYDSHRFLEDYARARRGTAR